MLYLSLVRAPYLVGELLFFLLLTGRKKRARVPWSPEGCPELQPQDMYLQLLQMSPVPDEQLRHRPTVVRPREPHLSLVPKRSVCSTVSFAAVGSISAVTEEQQQEVQAAESSKQEETILEAVAGE